MRSINDYNFLKVWQTEDPDLLEEIVNFWAKENVLTDEIRRKRVKEVVFVIRNNLDEIVGLSTAFETKFDLIDNQVFVYRCFINDSNRAPALDTQLIIKTRDLLEAQFNENGKGPIGLLVVAQNDFLKQWNKAVWPGSEMTYIGNSPQGDPVRIYYFKHAKI